MPTLRLRWVAFSLILSGVPAEADVIWLHKETLTTDTSISWLDPQGGLQTISREDQLVGPLSPGTYASVATAGTAPIEVRPPDLEVSSAVYYTRALDSIWVLMRGDTEGCANNVDCWLSGYFASTLTFTVEGSNSLLHVSTDRHAGRNDVTIALYDETARATLADFHGPDSIGFGMSVPLIDGHRYSLLASMVTVGTGDKETFYDVVFDNSAWSEGGRTGLQPAPVPEPSSLLLLGSAIITSYARRRRQQRTRSRVK